MSVSDALERLGSDVWDTLLQASETPAPEGSGEDGLNVLADPSIPGEVAVVLRLEGPLLGCGTAGVRRPPFQRWERALLAAGFEVRRHDVNEVPLVLYVTRPDETSTS